MFGSFKRFYEKYKWNGSKTTESNTSQTPYILTAFIGILEDVLFWKSNRMSLLFIFILNIIFLVCIQCEISLLQFTLAICVLYLTINSLEAWLKYKHRKNCLKRLAENDGKRLKAIFMEIKDWITRQINDLILLTETNSTKAFLIIGILLLKGFLLQYYFGVHFVLYVFCMFICFYQKLVLPIQRLILYLHNDIDSDNELEGFIPKISEEDLNLLSIEPEPTNTLVDDKQAFECWKPEDLPIEEASDSSDNSSSLVTNFSINTINTLEKDIETSDSSEDEYIPLDQPKDKLRLKSTMKVEEIQRSWSSSAYNTLWNLTGTVANMMSAESNRQRKRVSSIDLSDDFEMVDSNDL